jgi:hypothetical protein
LVFSRHAAAEVAFKAVTGVALLLVAYLLQWWILGIFALLVLLLLPTTYHVARIAQQVRQDIPVDAGDFTGDIPREHLLRLLPLLESWLSEKLRTPKHLASYARQVWQRVCCRAPPLGTSAVLLATYVSSCTGGVGAVFWFALESVAYQDAESLRRSCEDGNAVACSNLGNMYYGGEGVTRDLARAASLYQQACDGGSEEGCSNLGVLYENGEGVPQDFARAASLYQQACDGGSGEGCSNLGLSYENGEGVPQDFARAASLYQQACDGGSALGCFNLGLSYEKGLGVTRDLARAASLFREACDGGVAVACR